MVARKRRGPKRDISDDRSRIRAVFLDRRATYSTLDAVQLSGIDREDLLDRIETGEIDAAQRVTYAIPWDDVARLLMECVPLEAIYDALGDRADEVLPPLLRLERLDVRVPAYILRVLELVASRAGMTVERHLRGEFFDMVESLWRTHPEVDQIPGAGEALFFPDDPPRRRKP